MGPIPWDKLRNPVYRHEGWSVKDACMIEHRGWHHLFFSAFYHDAGRERSHVVGVRTRDFIEFSEPLFNWRGKNGGWIGLCSPDITADGGWFYLAYNSWGDKPFKPNQLFVARSRDLASWEFEPLARDVTRGVRAIDAALAFDDDGVTLAYKAIQTPVIARAPSLAGPWRKAGKIAGGLVWCENYQLVRIDGHWHLVATTKGKHPAIATMEDEAASGDERWLSFSGFRDMVVPVEAFNTRSRANAPFLADRRAHDGHFYLLYAGSTEGRTHAGRGDNALGLARSRDLVSWTVPPAP